MRWKPGPGGDRNRRTRISALLTGALLLCGCGSGPGQNDPATAFRLAQRHYRNADLERAGQVAHEAAGRASGLWAGKLQLVYAQSLLARNRMDEAWNVLQSPSIRTSSDASTQARLRMLEAAALSRRGQFRQAHEAFEDASGAAVRARDVETQVEILLSRALTCAREQDLNRGNELLSEALDLAVRYNDRYHQAAALLNMALFDAKRGRFDQAALRLQRVLTLCDQRDDTGIIRSAALGNLSMCYSRLGDFEKAIQMRRQAISFQEKAGLRLYLAQSFAELGNLYMVANDPAGAVPWFRRAAESAQAGGAKTETAEYQSGLAEALTLSGNLDEAEAANRRALTLRAGQKNTAGHDWMRMTEARILARRGRDDEAVKVLKLVAADAQEAQAAWEAHAELAVLHSQAGRTKIAHQHFGEALRIIDQTTSELARTEFRMTFLSRLIGFYQRFVQSLISDGQVERALEVADATRGRVLAERVRERNRVRSRGSAPAFRQIARQSGTVILAYWISPQGSHVWVVTAEGVHHRTLADHAAIESLTAEHTDSIEKRMENPVALRNPAAARLYDAIVRPVEDLIPQGSKVILVPDGPLYNINFETLVASQPNPHYWIEDVTLSVAPSLGLLQMDSASRMNSQNRLLLIGDPMNADTAYPELRHAAEELRTVKQHFPNALQHSRANATPSSYKSSASTEFSLIHFAAHAEANHSSPLDSAIILSPEKDRYKLYSRDVVETPIAATLVTLSACRGAGSRTYSGEGLVGFSWAFLDAGAKNVIAGLWDVSDRSTAKLMKRLYEGLEARGLEPAASLREAKLAVLRAGGPEARPWYWGPFQVYTRVWHPATQIETRSRQKR